MSIADWLVLLFTLAGILCYGIVKSRNQHGAATYLLADRQMPWYVVLLGVMATQASAITFLSAPGQAYTDGMRFVQYYFGLPLAMIVICVTFIPIFQRLNVYTAYEYLESRFDRKTRLLTAVLFLVSRGLSTGISIYAPSIILSSILGWNVYTTNVITGGLLILYTFTGGAKAIAHTQKLQFVIILSAMAVAGYLVVRELPEGIGFSDALYVAGKSGKLNVITTEFDWKDKYNIWSGVIGGFFLALSYFGTDNSQVSRYLTAKNLRESRMGLLFNGLVKVPMQFLILLIGALLFSFYAFYHAPLNFNEAAYRQLQQRMPEATAAIEITYNELQETSRQQAVSLVQERHQPETFLHTQAAMHQLRDSVQQLIATHVSSRDNNDTNYIFLYFVTHTLPRGLVGLLFAVIFLASWGSISAALNSLAGSSLMDVQLLLAAKKQSVAPPEDVPSGDDKQAHMAAASAMSKPFSGTSEAKQLWLGRAHTLFWGIFCIAVAMFATRMGSLIEAVNILGSLFYGTILGIFLVAFYLKKIGGTSIFWAAILAEAGIILIYMLDIISFLWLNVIGAVLVILFSLLLQVCRKQ